MVLHIDTITPFGGVDAGLSQDSESVAYLAAQTTEVREALFAAAETAIDAMLAAGSDSDQKMRALHGGREEVRGIADRLRTAVADGLRTFIAPSEEQPSASSAADHARLWQAARLVAPVHAKADELMTLISNGIPRVQATEMTTLQ